MEKKGETEKRADFDRRRTNGDDQVRVQQRDDELSLHLDLEVDARDGETFASLASFTRRPARVMNPTAAAADRRHGDFISFFPPLLDLLFRLMG